MPRRAPSRLDDELAAALRAIDDGLIELEARPATPGRAAGGYLPGALSLVARGLGWLLTLSLAVERAERTGTRVVFGEPSRGGVDLRRLRDAWTTRCRHYHGGWLAGDPRALEECEHLQRDGILDWTLDVLGDFAASQADELRALRRWRELEATISPDAGGAPARRRLAAGLHRATAAILLGWTGGPLRDVPLSPALTIRIGRPSAERT